MSAARPEPLARHAHGLRPGRRTRQPADGADRQARQARGLFRRQDPHHRFRAVERGELRHPADRRRHPVQGAQPDPAPSARLELLSPRAQRELRHPAGEPARLRKHVVRGHGRCGLPEHRHHRVLRPRIHHDPGRRSCLQDGLRADAAAACRHAAPTSPSAAWRCRAWKPPASASCMSTRTTGSTSSWKSRRIRRHAGQARTWRSPAWASMCSTAIPVRTAPAATPTDPDSNHDFGKDIIPYLVKNGKAVAHRFTRLLRPLRQREPSLLARRRHGRRLLGGQYRPHRHRARARSLR